MSQCERFEVQISSLIDGELSQGEMRPLMDHIIQCPLCQSFHQEAETLQKLTDDLMLATELEISPVALTEEPQPRRFSLSLFPAAQQWAWGAAAAVILAIGLTAAQVIPDPTGLFRPNVAAAQVITLEAEAGSMDNARFVELSTELLQADKQYHRMMFDLLDQIRRSEFIGEGSQLIASSGELSANYNDSGDNSYWD
jgi:hypothetical protein